MTKIETTCAKKESKQIPQEIQGASDVLEKEVGINWKIMERIAGSPKLRKAFMAIAFFVGLNAGQRGFAKDKIEGPGEKSGTEEVGKSEERDMFNKIFESLKELINKLKQSNAISDKNYPGWYFGNIGKYEVECFDANKDGEISPGGDRMSIEFKDKDNTKYLVGISLGHVNNIAINFEKQPPGFKKMSAGAFKREYGVIVRLEDSAIVYVRELSVSEAQEIIDDAGGTKVISN